MSYICCYSGYLFLGGYLFLKADISCAKCMRDFSQFLDAIAAKCNFFLHFALPYVGLFL